MKKTMKKILCSLLVVIMCLTSAPLEGFIGLQWPELPSFDIGSWFSNEASAINQTGMINDSVYYIFDSVIGELTIKGKGKMTTTSYSPFRNSSQIKRVVIESGITNINGGLFLGCKNLTEVVIPDTVTYIGSNAFDDCDSLTEITLPNSVTSIESGCFYDCDGLKTISLPNGITSIYKKTFYDCDALETVNLPDSIKTIYDEAFYDCDSIKEIKIPAGVTVINVRAFYSCDSLEKVTIAPGVKSILNQAFDYCENLKVVNINDLAAWCKIDFDFNPLSLGCDLYLNDIVVNDLVLPRNISEISARAFQNCTSITSVYMPDNITEVGGGAFYNCPNLTNVVLGNNVKTLGSSCFSYCTNLKNISLPNSLTWVSGFSGCTGLTSIIIPEGVTSIEASAFSGCSNLKKVTLPSTIKNIYDDAFKNCNETLSVYVNGFKTWYDIDFGSNAFNNYSLYFNSNLVSNLVIPDTITEIKDNLFNGCNSILSATINKNITSIGANAFSNCANLKTVTMQEGVTSIGASAFLKCTSLKKVVLPNSLTSISKEMFKYCESLIDITIPAGVEEIGGEAFNGCSSLTSVVIPSTVTVGVGYGAFYNCANLTSLTIESGVTNIDYRCFAWCKNLKSVTIPGSLGKISSSLFQYCSELTDVVIEEGIVSIAGFAFGDCIKLKNITFPDSLTAIYNSAFENCASLESVVLTDSQVYIGDYVFQNCTNLKNITADAADIVGAFALENTAFYNDKNNWEDGFLYLGNTLVKADSNVTEYEVPHGITTISAHAFRSCYSLTNVILPYSITYIGEEAFAYCKTLEGISLGDGVTEIGKYAFYGCAKLEYVAIPSTLMSIGYNAFEKCGHKKVYIYDLESWLNLESDSLYSNPLSTGADLYLCGELVTDLVIPESITRIKSSVFYKCSSIQSVTMHDDVTYIDVLAFSNCQNLREVNFGKNLSYIGSGAFDDTSVISVVFPDNMTSLGGFSDCYYLNEITVGKNTEYISGFNRCPNLQNVIIADGVEVIGEAWFDNITSSLRSITIPSSVKEIGADVFKNCTNLQNVYIEDLDAWCEIDFYCEHSNPLSVGAALVLDGEVVKDITISNVREYSFTGYQYLTDVKITEGITQIPYDAFNDCINLKNVEIPEKVTNIGRSAFKNCEKIEEITLPKSLTTIKSDAFSGCKNIESVYISDLKAWCEIDFSSNPLWNSADLYLNDELVTDVIIPATVSQINAAFKGCTSLVNVNISNGVKAIGENAFANCLNLTNITIPNSVNSIGSYAFQNCESLTGVEIPSSVSTIGAYVFRNCKNLENINIHDGLNEIGTGVFYGCTNLKDVYLSKKLKNISPYLFYNCANITNITIPSGVDTICTNAFYGCKNLSNLTLPANLEVIEPYAFNGCVGIEELILPNGLTTIDSYSFASCEYILKIIIPNSVTYISDTAFNNSKCVTIYGSKDSAAEYFARERGINFKYGGYLSNGLWWEVRGEILRIEGDSTYIPGFDPGEAPWSTLADIILTIVIDIPNLQRIGQYAFYGLTNVEKINFYTENVFTVGKFAFYSIRPYMRADYSGTSESWKKISVDYGNDSFKYLRVQCFGDEEEITPEVIAEILKDLEERQYISEHITIANNKNYANATVANSFKANTSIDKTSLFAYKSWEFIGNIGDILEFDVGGLLFKANVFDAYLSELVLSVMNEKNIKTFDNKLNKVLSDTCELILGVVKSEADWVDDLDKSLIEDLKEFLLGKTHEMPEGVKTLFEESYKKDKNYFKKLFSGISKAGEIFDKVGIGIDLIETFRETYKAYVTALAFYEVSDEFFKVCKLASYKLLDTEFSYYGDKFLDSIRKIEKSSMSDKSIIFEQVYTLIKGSAEIAYEECFKELITKVAYVGVGKLLGNAAVAPELFAVSFAYNTTYEILDAVTGLGKKSDTYRAINALRPIEEGFQKLVAEKKDLFLYSRNLKTAMDYDMSYTMLRLTNLYLYDLAYKYGSCVSNRAEMNCATAFKTKWSGLKCHFGTYGQKFNTFSAHCPVDVYIYNSDGHMVAAVINEKVEVCYEDITICVANGEKSFSYPADNNYTVKIIAREDGVMDYSAGVICGEDVEFEANSYNIPLEEKQEFVVEMPTSDEEATADDFKLITNETLVDFDYNSENACQSHIFGEWYIDGETKERTCNTCGYKEYITECNHSDYKSILAYSVVPTCQKGGHTIYVCAGCGEKISDGEDVDKVECSYIVEEVESGCTEKPYTKNTCVYCDDFYYDGITSEELNASTHDYTVTVTESTCISSGYTEYYCNVCGHNYIGNVTEIDKDLHDIRIVSITAPTCSENGYVVYECTLCGYTSKQDEFEAIGHIYEWTIADSNCTEKGYVTLTCSECGYSFVSDEIAADGHSYRVVVTKPTCAASGYSTYTCMVCADSYVGDTVVANGHNYTGVVTKPTCTAGGYTTYTCSVCADSYVGDTVVANGHNYTGVVTDPTCTAGGYTIYTCSVCGGVYRGNEVASKGHSYKGVVTNPTCTEGGYTTYTCSVCNDTYMGDKTTAIGHKYTTNKVDSSCFEDGIVTFTCDCGNSYSEKIPATGHNFNGSKCSACGYDKADYCSCNCHKGGVSRLVWKILRFFYKLFGKNKICSCGVTHY